MMWRAGHAGRPANGNPQARSLTEPMARIFLIVAAVGLVLLAAGAVYLGAFPPNPQPKAVEKVVPNEKFQSH
jgi:hypothetical protein